MRENEGVMRLMLLFTPTLVFTAGCRASENEAPPPSKPVDNLAQNMKTLIYRAFGEGAGLRFAIDDPVRYYTRDNLYEYIDGGAERYLGYSFDRAAVGRAYAENETYDIQLYHFGKSADAYGIWSADAAGEDVKIGQGSVYAGGLLQLWRGSFYARIYQRRHRLDSRETVLAVGRALAEAIGEDGALPELLKQLPTEGLQGTPAFFHEQPMLSYLYYVGDANLLRLGPSTDAIFATYKQGDEKAKLLIVRYPGDKATEARKAFVKDYLEAKPTSGPCIVKLENGLFSGISGPQDKTLRIVFDATSREMAGRLSGSVRRTGM
jgi:hypothetical protein